MPFRPEELRLYLVTDRRYSPRTLVEQVRAAVAGGATLVQLREKDAPDRETLALGRELLAVLRDRNVKLIVNNRVDLALAMGADGVHLGQGDLPVRVAREILGPQAVIGASANTIEEARAAQDEGADYLGIGAMFPTDTKKDHADVIGPEGLRRIRKALSLPLAGIGGIDETNAATVMEAGADGVAVISAILKSGELSGIERAARGLRKIVDRASSS